MKRIWVIGLILASFLASCTSLVKDTGTEVAEQGRMAEGTSHTLASIDSLMWRQPDSALALLLPYFDTCCRDALNASLNVPNGNFMETHAMRLYNGHYAQLLLSELLYKNDYEQTNRCDLQKAVCYFDSLCCRDVARRVSTDPTIAFLDARAHYINGVGYYENDRVVEACKEYLKALEVMEERFEEKELVGEKAQLVAMTYTHLTDLFSSLYLHEGAIYFGKKSIDYFSKYDANSWHIAWVLNEIGTHYDMMDDLDSAYCYYKSAFAFIEDTNTIIYRDVVTHLICLEYKKNHLQADNLLLRMFHLLSKSENDLERLSRCAIIGELFYHEEQYDSAWHYLNTVYRETPSVGMKKQAAEWLVEIGKMQGKNAKVNEFADFLVPFANLEENTSEIKSQLTELYKAFCQVQQERHHQSEMRRHSNQSIIVVAGLSSLIIIVVALYFNKKRQKKHLENQINDEKQAHNIEKKALSSRLKKSNETLRELKDQIKRQDDAAAKNKTAASFTEEPICRLILERVKEGQFKSKMNHVVYKDSALNKQQLLDLRLAADRHFTQFTIRLKKSYPELTNSDLDYCCLYLLGLTNADIAALMQRAYNTVVERDGKLKRILGNDNPLPLTLMGIAKG